VEIPKKDLQKFKTANEKQKWDHHWGDVMEMRISYKFYSPRYPKLIESYAGEQM
jgi:hypothetical protein